MTKHARAPGERFSADNTSRFPISSDNDLPHDRSWNYVGTFDNDATVTQLRFLAKVIRALDVRRADSAGAVGTPRLPSATNRIVRRFCMDSITFLLRNIRTEVGRRSGRCKAVIMMRLLTTITRWYRCLNSCAMWLLAEVNSVLFRCKARARAAEKCESRYSVHSRDPNRCEWAANSLVPTA